MKETLLTILVLMTTQARQINLTKIDNPHFNARTSYILSNKHTIFHEINKTSTLV